MSDRLPSLTPTEVAAGHRSPVPLCAPPQLRSRSPKGFRPEVPCPAACSNRTTALSAVSAGHRSPVPLCASPLPCGGPHRCLAVRSTTTVSQVPFPVWWPQVPRPAVRSTVCRSPQVPCPAVCSNRATHPCLQARSPHIPCPCLQATCPSSRGALHHNRVQVPQVSLQRSPVPLRALITTRLCLQVPCPAVCSNRTLSSRSAALLLVPGTQIHVCRFHFGPGPSHPGLLLSLWSQTLRSTSAAFTLVPSPACSAFTLMPGCPGCLSHIRACCAPSCF